MQKNRLTPISMPLESFLPAAKLNASTGVHFMVGTSTHKGANMLVTNVNIE